MGRIRTPITAALLALTTMTGCSGDPTPTARAMPAEQVAVMVMTSGE